MKVVGTLFSLIALASATSALADDPKPQAKPNDSDIVVSGEGVRDDPELDKIICRSDQAVGSRLKTVKICKSRRQWIADKEQDRRDIDRIQANRSTGSGG